MGIFSDIRETDKGIMVRRALRQLDAPEQIVKGNSNFYHRYAAYLTDQREIIKSKSFCVYREAIAAPSSKSPV